MEKTPEPQSCHSLFTNGTSLASATMLGVVAHPDDIELGMPWAPIGAISKPGESFAGITCTDGAGGYRARGYERLNAQEYATVRREEQAEAARVGKYVAQVQLGVSEPSGPSKRVVDSLSQKLIQVLDGAAPRAVFTHSLFDRHPWHRAVALATLRACRDLALMPEEFLGVEIWGGLEWLEHAGVAVPFTDPGGVAGQLVACYPSQQGHTPYGQAADARRFANGTYRLGREIGVRQDVSYAMDLRPLLSDHGLSPSDYCAALVEGSFSNVLRDLSETAN